MIEVKGKEGITVKVLQDSFAVTTGKRIVTFEAEMPRMIWSECLTHRLFSRNAASSRAIPVKKKREHVSKNPAMPVYWGKNKPGMQAAEELTGNELKVAKSAWWVGTKLACFTSWLFEKANLHKQLANRPLEWAERYKVVITSTEYENWLWLRDHKDAQPEIQELAKLMNEAMNKSKPFKLYNGEWHVPYVDRQRIDRGQQGGGSIEYSINGKILSLEEAKMISSSCCAQVSYRVLNSDLDKAKSIFKKLIESKPIHASPTEHQATPMWGRDSLAYGISSRNYELGITHVRIGLFEGCNLWSGNFCGWIQHRQLIKDNAKW